MSVLVQLVIPVPSVKLKYRATRHLASTEEHVTTVTITLISTVHVPLNTSGQYVKR